MCVTWHIRPSVICCQEEQVVFDIWWRFHTLPLVHVLTVNCVTLPWPYQHSHCLPSRVYTPYRLQTAQIGQKAQQELFLHYFLSAGATKVLFAFGSKKAGHTGGSGSGPIHVYKIPDGDRMGKHSSGAEHTAELLWIFGSSFCCHLLWSISSCHHGRKNDQKKAWCWQEVNTSKLVWTGQNRIQGRNKKTVSEEQRSDVLEQAVSDVYISKAN